MKIDVKQIIAILFVSEIIVPLLIRPQFLFFSALSSRDSSVSRNRQKKENGDDGGSYFRFEAGIFFIQYVTRTRFVTQLAAKRRV